MSINLTILQSFNNAVNSANRLNDNTRLQNESFNLNGKCKIKQIPANKYDHVANNAVRRNFAAALTGAFGVKSLEELPEGVRKSLKIGDFKLDKNGEITSTRPLTARRVRAVMSAIQEVTAKAAPNRQEAEAIRRDFKTYLENSVYMKAAFDRIAIAEGRKPLTLNIPLISNESFEVPLSALKAYTKGIKPTELAAKLDDIKLAIAADAAVAKETLGQLMRGETVPSDAARANALRHYFALCAVASDETGNGISRTVSVPDANGKIAEFLKASLKDSDDMETGVVHTPADPFLIGSKAMTRFSVEIGFKESARYGGEAWMGAFRAYECLMMTDGFSPIMERGYDPPMAISQMYSNISAESTRLLNAFDAEMEALFKAYPSFKSMPSLNFEGLPQPFGREIQKILSLRNTLQDFLSQLVLAKPIYGDKPALRYANETILTENHIPAMNLDGVNAAVVNQVAEVGAPAEPHEGLTLEEIIQDVATKANREYYPTDDACRAWAVATLINQLREARYISNPEVAAFVSKLGKEGNIDEAIKYLNSFSPREISCLHRCAQFGAVEFQGVLRVAGASVDVFELYKCGELPLTLSSAFFNAFQDGVLASQVGRASNFNDLTASAADADKFVNFEGNKWGFGTTDLTAVMRLVKASGYDPSTITSDDMHKLMALARLCDYRLGDIPAFFGRILHKTVPEITTDDVKTLFMMYKANKLMDPLLAVKPGRTADVISLFRGDMLPSSTSISGKEMVRIVATLHELAKDGGAKEVTVRFNDKAVKLRQLEGGQLYVTVNGVMVAGGQTAATLAKIFESDMASHVDRYGAENLLRMLPELTVADLADQPGSTSHTRELCLRIVEDRFGMPATSFATIPTSVLRTIAANALKGYYTTETGDQNKAVVSSLLAANVRNDVFTGEEVRDLHAAMMNTKVEELNRKVVFFKPPAPPKALFLTKEQRLAEMQVKVRNLFADFIMNADIISYDEAQRKGKGAQRILNLLRQNLDTFVEVIMDPKSALAGLAEPMRSALEERLTELAEALPHDPNANAFVKSAMKAMYRNALTVMLDVAALPEAERASAVAEKVNANTALKGAIALKQTTLEDLSSMILDMIPQIAQLDTAMDDLVKTAMAEIQNKVNEQFGVAEEAPEEAESAAAPRQEIWQQSFERLMGGAMTDTKSGYGKFMHEVLSHYFVEASPQEGRQMLASLFRNTDANSTPGQVVGALFKGAGPLLLKILQALPTDALGEDLVDALKDMKSNLQPIPDAIVKAHMLDIVNRSNGEIKSIEVIRSLGAASVGQAFLCRMITTEHPSGEECVVKLLRPNVKTIIENERQRFVKAAKNTPGMEKTFEGQYARILEELDFTKEKTNINFARNVYEQPVMIYHDGIVNTTERKVTMNTLHSMEVHPSVPPTMDSLILKKAPGETYDRYISSTRQKAREIVGPLNADGKVTYRDPGSLRAVEAKLIHLYNDTKRRQDFLLQLAEKWVQEALYGNGFYHGDLHAGNIMTDGKGLTVIDFGNATHLTDGERTHVIKMMAAAMYGRESYFEASLKALISDEGRVKYDSQNANGELTQALHEILNKGETCDAGRRIIAALTMLQQHGIELPGPVYNFAQCQMRLGAAVEEMTKLMNELDEARGKLQLESLENGDKIIQNGLKLVKDEEIFNGLSAINNLFLATIDSSMPDSMKDVAEELERIFGGGGGHISLKFNAEKLPGLLMKLQDMFNNREAFDACFKPVIERLTEVKSWADTVKEGVVTHSTAADELREKLNAFLASRDGDDVANKEKTVKELSKAFVESVRTLSYSVLQSLPDHAEAPEDGAFVGAVATVVNANLQSAISRLGTMMVPTAFDMYFANKAISAANERIVQGRKKIIFYLKNFTNNRISLDTAKMLERMAEDFQHPLKMPGLNGKANSLNTVEKRATFLSTLQFNLTKLEEALRTGGRLDDMTPPEVKKHFVCIAMEFFADRIGGIADAVHKMPEATYQMLYNEAGDNDVGVLSVRDALAYFRNPIELPQEEPPVQLAPAVQ